jgi:hypothetical protein
VRARDPRVDEVSDPFDANSGGGLCLGWQGRHSDLLVRSRGADPGRASRFLCELRLASSESLAVVPRHPIGDARRHVVLVTPELEEMEGWVLSSELATSDEARAEIADSRSTSCLVEEAVLAEDDHSLQDALKEVVVSLRARSLSERDLAPRRGRGAAGVARGGDRESHRSGSP